MPLSHSPRHAFQYDIEATLYARSSSALALLEAPAADGCTTNEGSADTRIDDREWNTITLDVLVTLSAVNLPNRRRNASAHTVRLHRQILEIELSTTGTHWPCRYSTTKR